MPTIYFEDGPYKGKIRQVEKVRGDIYQVYDLPTMPPVDVAAMNPMPITVKVLEYRLHKLACHPEIVDDYYSARLA